MSDSSAPVRLVISGATGRMGTTLSRLASADPSVRIAGGIDREGSDEPGPVYPIIASPAAADELLSEADVVVDFSAPALLHQLLEARERVNARCAIVVGTTGLGEDVQQLLEQDASRAPVLVSANFSLGVNLLLQLTETVARALGPTFDVEIVEAHHRRKEDAPSGTALAIARAVAAGHDADLQQIRRDGRSGRVGARPSGELGIHAVRGGDVVGDHHVHFLGDLERLELVHRASDRAVFAAGALHAAKWIAASREPGTYTMRQVLGL